MAKPMVVRFEFETARGTATSHRKLTRLWEQFQDHDLGKYVVAHQVTKSRLRVDIRWCWEVLKILSEDEDSEFQLTGDKGEFFTAFIPE